MRSRPDQPFSNAIAVMNLGPSSIQIGLIYPNRADLEADYRSMLIFHGSQQGRSGNQLRIEKTKSGTSWLEISCWSRDKRVSKSTPAIAMRLREGDGDRPEIIEHLKKCDRIEAGFICLEVEDIDKVITRLKSGDIDCARGTNPILLRQMRILGQLCRASYAES